MPPSFGLVCVNKVYWGQHFFALRQGKRRNSRAGQGPRFSGHGWRQILWDKAGAKIWRAEKWGGGNVKIRYFNSDMTRDKSFKLYNCRILIATTALPMESCIIAPSDNFVQHSLHSLPPSLDCWILLANVLTAFNEAISVTLRPPAPSSLLLFH